MNNKVLNIALIVVAIGAITTTVFSSAKEKQEKELVTLDKKVYETISKNNAKETKEVKETGEVVDGVQVIEVDLEVYGYPNLVVQKDVPVKFIINATKETLNSCNNEIIMQDFGLRVPLKLGKNVIEFTPTETGDFVYTCWMGMIGANISVVDENIVPSVVEGSNIVTGGCCSRKY